MSIIMDVKLVNFDRIFLDLSWCWTNDEEIRKLIDAPIIHKYEQEKWFDSLKYREDYLIYGIEFEGIPIGVAGLKRINDDSAYVYWYIGEKDYWGKKIGQIIAKEISFKAKEKNINTLYGEVKYFNIRSINLFFKEGYKIISFEKTTGFYIMEKKI